MGDWVVVLEFGVPADVTCFELTTIQALVERLGAWQLSGVYRPQGYAVELHVPAGAADEALRTAAILHEQAVKALGVSAAFLRAEVLTRAEFDGSWHDDALAGGRLPSGRAQALVSQEVYEATRALLGATTPSEVTDVLVNFVLSVGGRVSVGETPAVPGAVSLDLGTSPTDPRYAFADGESVALLILERWLPPLLDDARRAVALLGGRE